MNVWQAIFLGALQGLTEFLPISSSGHLVVAQKIFHFNEAPVFFDILIHLGTLLAILVFFRRQFLKTSFKLVWLLFLGTLPAVFVGLFLDKHLQFIFNSLIGVATSWLITAIFLFSTHWLKKKARAWKS